MKKKKFKIQPKTWPKEYTFEEFKNLNPNTPENVLINYYHKYLQEYAESYSRHIKYFNDTKEKLVTELHSRKDKKEHWDFESYDTTVGPPAIIGGQPKDTDKNEYKTLNQSIYLSGSTEGSGSFIYVPTPGVGVGFKPLKNLTVNIWVKPDGNFTGSEGTGSANYNIRPKMQIIDSHDNGGYQIAYSVSRKHAINYTISSRVSGAASYGGFGSPVFADLQWQAAFNSESGLFPNGYGNGPLIDTGTNGGTTTTGFTHTTPSTKGIDGPGKIYNGFSILENEMINIDDIHNYPSKENANNIHMLQSAYGATKHGWHMITMTFDGRYQKNYLNGKLLPITESVYSQSFTQLYASNPILDHGENCEGISYLDKQYSHDRGLIVGGQSTGVTGADLRGSASMNFYTGSVSNLSVFNSTFTEQDVSSLYDRGMGWRLNLKPKFNVSKDKRNKHGFLHKHRGNLQLWLKMNDIEEGSGIYRKVPDSSGNGYHGFLQSGEDPAVGEPFNFHLTSSNPSDDVS